MIIVEINVLANVTFFKPEDFSRPPGLWFATPVEAGRAPVFGDFLIAGM
jgi:hypothetical protein